jgi:hypothetical protein
LFSLPGGRPRRLTVISDIQAGGRPRLFPRPLASRSRLKIASSICSRSCRSSFRIFVTSIVSPQNRLCFSSLGHVSTSRALEPLSVTMGGLRGLDAWRSMAFAFVNPRSLTPRRMSVKLFRQFGNLRIVKCDTAQNTSARKIDSRHRLERRGATVTQQEILACQNGGH